jgi:hypothetical protein
MDQEEVLMHLRDALASINRARGAALTGSELLFTCGRLYGQVDAVAKLLADYTRLLQIFDQPSDECIDYSPRRSLA